MLQLLHSASPLTTHGAAAAVGMLRRLAPTDVTVCLGSQIRGFAADVASVSEVQVGVARVCADDSLGGAVQDVTARIAMPMVTVTISSSGCSEHGLLIIIFLSSSQWTLVKQSKNPQVATCHCHQHDNKNKCNIKHFVRF